MYGSFNLLGGRLSNANEVMFRDVAAQLRKKGGTLLARSVLWDALATLGRKLYKKLPMMWRYGVYKAWSVVRHGHCRLSEEGYQDET